jgi:hypothetical protein
MDSNGQPETFWKYQLMAHMLTKHLTELDQLPLLPLELIVTTHISKFEEIRMGIPCEKTEKWRASNQVLDSDDIMVLQQEGDTEDEGEDDFDGEDQDLVLRDVGEVGQSRKRGMSMASTSSRQGSPTKKHHTQAADPFTG